MDEALRKAAAYIEYLETTARQLEEESLRKSKEIERLKSLFSEDKRKVAEQNDAQTDRNVETHGEDEIANSTTAIAANNAATVANASDPSLKSTRHRVVTDAEKEELRSRIRAKVEQATRERDHQTEHALNVKPARSPQSISSQSPARSKPRSEGPRPTLPRTSKSDESSLTGSSSSQASSNVFLENLPVFKAHSDPNLTSLSTNSEAEELKSASHMNEEEKTGDSVIAFEKALQSSSSVGPSPISSLAAKIRPPPGLPSPPEKQPIVLNGILLCLESRADAEKACGEALLTASVNRRDMYAVVDDTLGNVLFRFEGSDAPRFTVTGLKLGGSTRLLLKNAAGKTVDGCSVTIDIPAIAPPLPPKQLTISDRQKTQVRLRWSAPVEDGGAPITNYEVCLCEGEDNPQKYEKIAESGKCECLIGKLISGSKYFVKVRAINALGESPYSTPPFCFVTLGSTTSPPSNIRLISENGNSMVVSWDEPEKTNGSEIDSYQVEMARPEKKDKAGDDVFSIVVNDLVNLQDGVKVTNLSEYSAYKFRVRAHNAHGFSGWSPVVVLQTSSALPKGLSTPVILDEAGEPVHSVAFNSAITVKWPPSASRDVTYHLEARPSSSYRDSEWETLFIGKSNSFNFRVDDTKLLYSKFSPGSHHTLCVSVVNERGRGPRSESLELVIRPVPPAPPTTPPRVLKCDVKKGLMQIQFDPSPHTGGSGQMGSVVEVRRKPVSRGISSRASNNAPELNAAERKNDEVIVYFENEEAMKEYINKRTAEKQQDKERLKAPSPPPKYDQGDPVDAIYHEDGRYYHASVLSVLPFSVSSNTRSYRVKFLGYGDECDVEESKMRPALKRGEPVTAVLYDTTPGAHAAGSTFVVKEHIRRLPAEIVSSTSEGYFVRFKGRGLAAQNTNAFDVFPLAATRPSPVTVMKDEEPSEAEDNDAANKMNSKKTSIPSQKIDKSHRPKPLTLDSSSYAIPEDLPVGEWFEACDTPDFTCTLRGLVPGAIYEIRIAAESEGGGRGSFGPCHEVRMDPGPPCDPHVPPTVHAVRSTGKIEFSLLPSFSHLVGEGEEPITGFQMQTGTCSVKAVSLSSESHQICKCVLYSVKDFVTYDKVFESSSSKQPTTVSLVSDVEGGSCLVTRYRCKNKVGWSSWSPPALVELPAGPPSQITQAPGQVAFEPSSVVLSGVFPPSKSNGSAIGAYQVDLRPSVTFKGRYLHTDESPWKSHEHTLNPSSSTLIKSMSINNIRISGAYPPGTTYEYRIRAKNDFGYGQWSNVFTFKVPLTVPQGSFSDVKVVPKSHREFEASWSFDDSDALACGGAIPFYDYEFVPFPGPPGPPPPLDLPRSIVFDGTTPNKTMTRNSKSQLKPNGSYWFRLRASNIVGAGPFSRWYHFTMPSLPSQSDQQGVNASIAKLLIRDSTTQADGTIVIQVDLLRGEDDVFDREGLTIRLEFQEKNASSTHVMDRISEYTVFDRWVSLRVETRELRANTNYLLRAQFVNKRGLQGEKSKAVGFATRAMPASEVVSTSEPELCDNGVNSALPDAKPGTSLKANGNPSKKLVGASAGNNSFSQWQVISSNPLQTTMFAVAVGVLVFGSDFHPAILSPFIVGAGVVVLVHWYVFAFIITPRKRTKRDVEMELEREKVARELKRDRDVKVMNPQVTVTKAELKRRGRQEKRVEKELKDLQDQPSLLSKQRLEMKREVLRFCSAFVYMWVWISWTLLRLNWAWFVGAMMIAIVGLLLTFGLYAMPGEMRHVIA